VAELHPDFLVATGDTVYYDSECRTLSCCHNPVRWNNWKNFLTLFRSTR